MKIILLFFLIIGNVFGGQDFFEIIFSAHNSTPVLVVDKESWVDLTTKEQQLLLNQVLDPFGMGSGYGNGGHLLQCSNKSQLILLDYFEATLPTFGGGTAFIEVEKYDLIDYFKKAFSPFPTFLRKFEHGLQVVGPSSSWISSDIKNSFDAHYAYNINQKECEDAKLLQVAIRQNHVVYVDPNLFKELSLSQQQLLRIHEVLYYLGEKFSGLTTSIPVRQIIRQVLQRESSLVDHEKMRLLLQQLSGEQLQYGLSWLSLSRMEKMIQNGFAASITQFSDLQDNFHIQHCLFTNQKDGRQYQIDFAIEQRKIELFAGPPYDQKGSFVTDLLPVHHFYADMGTYHMSFYQTPSKQLLAQIYWPFSKRTLFGVCQ